MTGAALAALAADHVALRDVDADRYDRMLAEATEVAASVKVAA